MEDTFGKTPLTAPSKDTKRTLPPGRFAEQTEPIDDDFAEVQDDDRLQQSISVGKKGESYSVAPDKIESLRPSAKDMKNG